MTTLLSRWGLLGIGLSYLLEAVGMPVPIEIPLWMSGHMILYGTASYWQLVTVTWAGNSAGNVLAFALARLAGRPLVERVANRLGLRSTVQRIERWMERYGLGTVVFTRWINWGYAISIWISGISRVRPVLTLGVMFANTAVWACAWVALGRWLVGVLHMAGLPGWLMLAPAIVLLALLGTWRLVARWRSRTGKVAE